MQSKDTFLTVDEAAEFTGFSHWSIRRWLSGSPPKLTRYKIGSRTVINREELLELIEPRKAQDSLPVLRKPKADMVPQDTIANIPCGSIECRPEKWV